LCNAFSKVALIVSKNNETYEMIKTCVCKLKEGLLHNRQRNKISLSSAPSLHLLDAYSICDEAINGRSHKCNKLRSPLVAKSKGKKPST
jgi:hypothetical protein